jgi:hypothetical protein
MARPRDFFSLKSPWFNVSERGDRITGQSNLFDGERVETGTASPPRAKAACSTEPRYGAIVHRRIDETLTGRPGSGSRPLLALALAQNHRSLIRQLAAVRGSQYPALPPPERLPPPLMPVPSGLFHLGHVPEDRPYGRVGYVVPLRDRHRYAVISLRRCRYRRCRSAAVRSFLFRSFG